MEIQQILESKAVIRFQDCDPFNHLNNAEYFNYLINAREDQVIENYGLDIYKHGKETGKSWVVSTHQIAYLRPAVLMETVTIQSQLINFTDKKLFVEIRMFDETKSVLKAIMWSSFSYFDLLKLSSAKHSEDLLQLFEQAKLSVTETTFEDRVKSLRFQKV
ncbi:acyl-CoA thioesterase [Tenacibaculum sp. M341]|uniref:acyl-CoA thioesterase n=1 Tax=Tenacibaculum sp. M341 TaxID=2530339 RepID=UPI0010530322|nr:acyl-CoA thioesterase [Tenacibaculum sp. M341]TCI85042.1 acyl-CoA thioesterase [Tenacibaculum sp. M341]